MEPPIKKMKPTSIILDNIETCIEKLNAGANIKAVLGDEFDQPIPLTEVYVGTVKENKFLSKIILSLNEKLPLKNLNHLKRVRGKNVIICLMSYLQESNCISIEELIASKVPDLKEYFESYKVTEVPAIAPKIKKQIDPKLWAVNFHPNKYLESITSDNFYNKEETKKHNFIMKLVFEATRWFLQKDGLENFYTDLKDVNTTVVIDPSCFKVVAVSFIDKNHPVKHSAMLAIDSVAKTQNGGAWTENSNDSLDYTLSGINSDLLEYLKTTFPEIQFGARKFSSKKDFVETSAEIKDVSDGPYLCTGYYIYMLKEPCLMCSMGLVHARAKRIFYCFDNKSSGGLKSKTKLQAVPSLNHHFEVFTGFIGN